MVWGNRASKVNELLRGFGVDVPYTVPAIADVADDEQQEEEAEMDEEEGDTNAPRKDKRQKKASRPARTSTSRTASRRVADLPLTKRRLRPQNTNK